MIRFEKFDSSDYSRFISWVPNEEFMFQFSGPIFTFPISIDQLDEYVECKTRQIFKVLDLQTQIVIGHAELNAIDLENKTARICRVLIGDSKFRNKGYGKAIIYELIRIAFEELQLQKLDLSVYDYNLAAIHCYKSCGFKIDGCQEGILIMKISSQDYK